MARGRSQGRRAAADVAAPATRSQVAGDWVAAATPTAARPSRGRDYRRAMLSATALAGILGAAWLGGDVHEGSAASSIPANPGRGIEGPSNLNAYQGVFGTSSLRPTRMKLRWPVKPFNRPHQIRSTFGEPRSLKMDRMGLRGYDWHAHLHTLNQMSVPGQRAIHEGVDIVARQGTPVYALQSGRAVLGGNGKYARWVRVGDFRYDHVTPRVKRGQKVIAFKTVVGVIATPDHHLHLTRSWKGRSINPLVYGGFVGYEDTAAPRLNDVTAYGPDGSVLDMNALRGKVAMTIYMDDLLSQGGAGVGVHSYGYRVVDAAGRVAVGPYTNYRANTVLPGAAADRLYTPATNRNDFDHDFWYRVTLRSPSGDGFLDTGMLAPGRYHVIVTAKDASGNATSKAYPIGVVR